MQTTDDRSLQESGNVQHSTRSVSSSEDYRREYVGQISTRASSSSDNNIEDHTVKPNNYVIDLSVDQEEDIQTRYSPEHIAFCWIKAFLEKGDDKHCIAKCDVYRNYTSCCQRWNVAAVRQVDFGKQIKSVFPDLICRRIGNRKTKKHSYCGIKKTDIDCDSICIHTLVEKYSNRDIYEASKDVIIQWASKTLGQSFVTYEDVAVYLVQNGLANMRSTSATQLRARHNIPGPKIRDTQTKLKRKILEKYQSQEQSPKSKQTKSNISSQEQVVLKNSSQEITKKSVSSTITSPYSVTASVQSPDTVGLLSGVFTSRLPPPSGVVTSQLPPPGGMVTSLLPPPGSMVTSQLPPPGGMVTSQAPLPSGMVTSQLPLPGGVVSSQLPLPGGVVSSQLPIPGGVVPSQLTSPGGVVASQFTPRLNRIIIPGLPSQTVMVNQSPSGQPQIILLPIVPCSPKAPQVNTINHTVPQSIDNQKVDITLQTAVYDMAENIHQMEAPHANKKEDDNNNDSVVIIKEIKGNASNSIGAINQHASAKNSVDQHHLSFNKDQHPVSCNTSQHSNTYQGGSSDNKHSSLDPQGQRVSQLTNTSRKHGDEQANNSSSRASTYKHDAMGSQYCDVESEKGDIIKHSDGVGETSDKQTESISDAVSPVVQCSSKATSKQSISAVTTHNNTLCTPVMSSTETMIPSIMSGTIIPSMMSSTQTVTSSMLSSNGTVSKALPTLLTASIQVVNTASPEDQQDYPQSVHSSPKPSDNISRGSLEIKESPYSSSHNICKEGDRYSERTIKQAQVNSPPTHHICTETQIERQEPPCHSLSRPVTHSMCPVTMETAAHTSPTTKVVSKESPKKALYEASAFTPVLPQLDIADSDALLSNEPSKDKTRATCQSNEAINTPQYPIVDQVDAGPDGDSGSHLFSALVSPRFHKPGCSSYVIDQNGRLARAAQQYQAKNRLSLSMLGNSNAATKHRLTNQHSTCRTEKAAKPTNKPISMNDKGRTSVSGKIVCESKPALSSKVVTKASSSIPWTHLVSPQAGSQLIGSQLAGSLLATVVMSVGPVSTSTSSVSTNVVCSQPSLIGPTVTSYNKKASPKFSPNGSLILLQMAGVHASPGRPIMPKPANAEVTPSHTVALTSASKYSTNKTVRELLKEKKGVSPVISPTANLVLPDYSVVKKCDQSELLDEDTSSSYDLSDIPVRKCHASCTNTPYGSCASTPWQGNSREVTPTNSQDVVTLFSNSVTPLHTTSQKSSVTPLHMTSQHERALTSREPWEGQISYEDVTPVPSEGNHSTTSTPVHPEPSTIHPVGSMDAQLDNIHPEPESNMMAGDVTLGAYEMDTMQINMESPATYQTKTQASNYNPGLDDLSPLTFDTQMKEPQLDDLSDNGIVDLLASIENDALTSQDHSHNAQILLEQSTPPSGRSPRGSRDMVSQKVQTYSKQQEVQPSNPTNRTPVCTPDNNHMRRWSMDGPPDFREPPKTPLGNFRPVRSTPTPTGELKQQVTQSPMQLDNIVKPRVARKTGQGHPKDTLMSPPKKTSRNKAKKPRSSKTAAFGVPPPIQRFTSGHIDPGHNVPVLGHGRSSERPATHRPLSLPVFTERPYSVNDRTYGQPLYKGPYQGYTIMQGMSEQVSQEQWPYTDSYNSETSMRERHLSQPSTRVNRAELITQCRPHTVLGHYNSTYQTPGMDSDDSMSSHAELYTNMLTPQAAPQSAYMTNYNMGASHDRNMNSGDVLFHRDPPPPYTYNSQWTTSQRPFANIASSVQQPYCNLPDQHNYSIPSSPDNIANLLQNRLQEQNISRRGVHSDTYQAKRNLCLDDMSNDSYQSNYETASPGVMKSNQFNMLQSGSAGHPLSYGNIVNNDDTYRNNSTFGNNSNMAADDSHFPSPNYSEMEMESVMGNNTHYGPAVNSISPDSGRNTSTSLLYTEDYTNDMSFLNQV